MLSSFTVHHQCGAPLTFTVSGTNFPEGGRCSKCGLPMFFIQPLGNVVGMLLLGRAESELKNGDFTLPILLSAMAVECEMLRLYIKWKGLDSMRSTASGVLPTSNEESVWEEEWRRLFRIDKRLDELSQLLIGQTLDSFVSQTSAGPLSTLYTKYPSLRSYSSAKKLLQEEFFNKRNKIMHNGQIDFSQADADVCFELAKVLTDILKAMDDQRIGRLDAELKVEGETQAKS